MCLSCGCGKPNEAHGDERHITMQKLEQAAKASDISPVKAAQNIQDGLRQQGGTQGERRGRDMEMETNP